MSKVHLYDCDNTHFPNLALLKISSWHKGRGDSVVWNQPLFGGDIDYSSRVFTWSEKPPVGDYKMGGWIDSPKCLPDEVEHICPDYEYMGYSLGFLSRGCPNKCWFCIVPEKEGDIRPHSKPEEFIRHKNAVFIDNNWLASPRWEKDFEWLKKNEIRCDFNQGLDARLIDFQIAERLSSLKWVRFIRLACDSAKMVSPATTAIQHLRAAGYSGEIFVYILVIDIGCAWSRVELLRGNNCDPFAQPYRDDLGRVDRQAQRFARWVNHKAIFKSVRWEDYGRAK